MSTRDFLQYLTNNNCTYALVDQNYNVTNTGTGQTTYFAKNGGRMDTDTVRSVCAQVGIASPV